MRKLDKDLMERFTNLSRLQKEFITATLKTIQGSDRLSYFAKSRGIGRTHALQTLDALLSTGLTAKELLNSVEPDPPPPQEQEFPPKLTKTVLSKEEYAHMKHFQRMWAREFMSDGELNTLSVLRKVHFSSCREMCIDPDTGACIHGNLDPCKAQQCPHQEPMRELTPEELEL